MDIHEYQAKTLLADYGVPIPQGGLAYSPEQAAYRAKEIGGDAWVVKAQVHAGGRGKAGGIKLCRDSEELWDAADGLLGRKLVNEQTGERGRGVYRLYVEEAAPIALEACREHADGLEEIRFVLFGAEAHAAWLAALGP